MRKKKPCFLAMVFGAALITVMLLPANPLFAQKSIQIAHKPLGYFVAGHRIRIQAHITDTAGIKAARCYFRLSEYAADFVFVAMAPIGGNKYEAILPAPGAHTWSLKYLFLAVNQNGAIVKTQTFGMRKQRRDNVPPWQQVGKEGNIRVSTEIAQTSGDLQGFSDSITMDIVESSARFGVVAGVYSAFKFGSGGGASGAVAGGGATSTGTSTTTIVAVSAGVVAAGAAVAVAAGSSGGDDGGGVQSSESPMVYPLPSEYVSKEADRIVIQFNKDMAADAHHVVVNSSYWGHSDTSDFWENAKTFNIIRTNTGTDLLFGEEITFSLMEFKDTDGNLMDDYSFTVIVGSGIDIEW